MQYERARKLRLSPVEQDQDWYFTWGCNQGHDNCYTIIFGTYESARTAMVAYWGNNWAFQYPSAEAAGVYEFNLKRL